MDIILKAKGDERGRTCHAGGRIRGRKENKTTLQVFYKVEEKMRRYWKENLLKVRKRVS